MADKSTVKVTFLGDASALARAAKQAQASTEAVGRSASKSGGAVGKAFGSMGAAAKGAIAGVMAGGLVAGGNAIFDMAAQMELMDNKSKTVFGNQIGVVQKWAKANANAMGLTSREATGLAANFADLLIPMGFTRQTAAKMSTDVVGLSGALSRWSGGKRTAAEVSEILAKAMLGERDGLKELGIAISEADVQGRLAKLGKDKLTGAALEQAKAEVTQALIMEKSADAQAAYAKGSGTLAAKKARLTAKFKEFRDSAVAKLIPLLLQLGEYLGRTLGPVFSQVGDALRVFTDAFRGRSEIDEFDGSLRTVNNAGIKVREVFDKTIATLRGLYAWYQQNKTLVESVAVAILAVVAAVKVYRTVVAVATAVQVVWNAVLLANPIGLVVLAIIGLVAGLVYAWKRSETFRNIVTGAFNAVKNVAVGAFNWVKKNWPLLLAILTGPIGLAVLFIVKKWDVIVDTVKGLGGRIKSAATGMFDGIKDAFRSALNWLIGKWNALEFKIPGFDPPGPGPKFGGVTIGVPDIPQLAQGGIVKARPGGTLVNVGEGGQDEAVVPLGRGGMGASGGVIGTLRIEHTQNGRVMWTELLKLKRELGGSLGLA